MTRIIVLCEWGRQVMLRNGVNAEQLALVRHGLAVAQSATAKAKDEGVVKLGFFGRLDPTKGLDVLVKAMKLVPQLPVELHCHLIMDAASRELMKPLLDKLTQDARILIHTPVAPDEVVKTMAGYDAVLVPSTWLETGPLVVLEAFAAGVPVLGSDLGGIAEWVVDGKNGLLLKPADPSEWAHGISRFVFDAEWRAHLRSGVQHPPLMCEVSAVTNLLYRECLI
jgi:glycosyltransferase involved in cell wall biosynthesis